MKKIQILITGFLAGLVLMTSCNPDEKFQSPDTTLQGSVPAFFAAMLNNTSLRTEYWQVRTLYADHIGIYAQTLQSSSANSRSAYKGNDGYIGSCWGDFYLSLSKNPEDSDNAGGGTLAMYRYMVMINKKDAADMQKINEPFLQAAKVVLYERTAVMVDLFGSIPFEGAESLHETALNTPAKFDDQKALYKMAIDDLKNVAAYFKVAKLEGTFSSKDALLRGNGNMWLRYANSIRLRLLMRMVESDPTYAQPLIMEIVNNPGDYPLVDGDNNPNYNPEKQDVLLAPKSSYTKTLKDALGENSTKTAPDFMLNTVMLPVNDIRIPVMFDKNRTKDFENKEYRAIPLDSPSDMYESLAKSASCWDSVTFWMNKELPGVRITATEVNLLKAEAFERWGATADAKKSFDAAIKQSVTFLHYLNNMNSDPQQEKEVKPADADIEKFVTERLGYGALTKDKKLEMIATQKWLHFGFLQSEEAWAEYRRTKMPKLAEFPTAGKENGYSTPPTRLMYPSKETSVNPNYSEVRAQDTRTTKIFWDVK